VTIDDLLEDIIHQEGEAYTDHPADRGGPTRYGITLGTLRRWRGDDVWPHDVEALTKAEALAIYRNRYVEAPGFAELPDPIRGQLVDSGVLSGPPRAIRDLQQVLGVAVDGVLGPLTLAALGASDLVALNTRLVRQRVERLVRLVQHDPSQLVFLLGWVRRALHFL
jgi:lysozyme family protein